jgi:AcrR family transcriptional regulator
MPFVRAGDGKVISGLPSHSPETKATARAEWTLGVKSIPQIARELGLSRTTVYQWAKDEEWPPRGQAQHAIRDAIDQQVIRSTAADLRSAAREDTGDAEWLQEQLAALGIEGGDEAPEGEVIVREYALAVAEVLRRHAEMANDALDIGRELLAMFGVTSKRLKAHFDRTPQSAKDATLKRMELVSKTAGQYATLVRSLQIAHRMQREALGIDQQGRGSGRAQDDDAPGAQPGTQSGSYEEVVAEASRRGVGLN